MLNIHEKVTWFQKRFPELVQDMKNSCHHGENLNPYHLEGGVWTHVMMVCKQAENESDLVQWAALLHDLGKPSTRQINKKGNACFYNHDAVSAFMALEVLEAAREDGANLTDDDIISIFKVISMHTQVFKLDSRTLGEAFRGDDKTAQLFYRLGLCDHQGRFTNLEGQVNCPSTAYEVKRETKKTVTLLCGLPASGKSTFIEGLDSGFVVSRDEFIDLLGFGETYTERYETANVDLVNKGLEKTFKISKDGSEVYVDMCHCSKKSRRRSLGHYGKDFYKKCIVFISPLNIIKLRNEQRNGKVIPEEVYDRMMKSFYPPTLAEFDEVEWRYSK